MIQPVRPAVQVSHVDLRMVDNVLTLTVDVSWPDHVYRRIVAPRMVGVLNQVKGKMAVYAGSHTWHTLAGAVVKYVEKNKQFPRGTIDRQASGERMGFPHPPAERISFFAELLPFLGRGQTAAAIDRDLPWFGERTRTTTTPGAVDPMTGYQYPPTTKTEVIATNAPAAESWVPELLVPYYQPTAWRASSPLSPERTFGGTNFVALAGVGRDAARYDPANPAHQKLVGISGYDWGSKVEEVTDGRANTIFLIQVPPAFSRPWMAGGGATVMGLNPADPMADFAFDHPDGRGGKKRGTYAIMGDGAVRWIPADIDPKVFLALATRAGGEKLPDLDTVAPKVEDPSKPAEAFAPVPAEPPAKPTDTAPPEKKEAGKTETPPAEKKEGQ
jgi:hypothetical protein